MNAADIAGLALDEEIELFELSEYSGANIYRFCNKYSVNFGGFFYQALGVSMSTFPISSQGEIPSVEIKINDASNAFATVRSQFPGIVRAKLTAYSTLYMFLDGQATANSAKKSVPFVGRISHATKAKPGEEYIFVVNSRAFELDKPHGRDISPSCTADLGDGVSCPYVGGGGGINVGNFTVCSGKISGTNGCSAHFSAGVSLPILGLPFAERIVV